MSKNSPKKTERRHKRELKQKRRSKLQQQKNTVFQRQQPAEQLTFGFDKTALRPPSNDMSVISPKHVLTKSNRFDPQKWKPHEEDPS